MRDAHKTGDGNDFSAIVVHRTDYSPNRKTPL
jgi:hypothetical protein